MMLSSISYAVIIQSTCEQIQNKLDFWTLRVKIRILLSVESPHFLVKFRKN